MLLSHSQHHSTPLLDSMCLPAGLCFDHPDKLGEKCRLRRAEKSAACLAWQKQPLRCSAVLPQSATGPLRPTASRTTLTFFLRVVANLLTDSLLCKNQFSDGFLLPRRQYNSVNSGCIFPQLVHMHVHWEQTHHMKHNIKIGHLNIGNLNFITSCLLQTPQPQSLTKLQRGLGTGHSVAWILQPCLRESYQ